MLLDQFSKIRFQDNDSKIREENMEEWSPNYYTCIFFDSRGEPFTDKLQTKKRQIKQFCTRNLTHSVQSSLCCHHLYKLWKRRSTQKVASMVKEWQNQSHYSISKQFPISLSFLKNIQYRIVKLCQGQNFINQNYLGLLINKPN